MQAVRGHAGIAAIVLLAAIAGPARAADPKAGDATLRARALYAEGQALFQKGSYREASARFSKGYDLSKKPAFLFNMAECARMLDDKKSARDLYVRYLTHDTRGRYRAEATSRCQALQLGPCAPKEKPVRPAKKPARIWPVQRPAPGPPAKPDRASVILTRRPPPPPPPKTPLYKRWELWTAVGAAVVAGTVTAVVLATRGDDPSAIHEGDHVVRVP
jgi:hypothetical protein